MKVSGLSILARKALVTRRFGAEAWRGLFMDVAQVHVEFRKPITATTFLPLHDYLAFHDELVRRFYTGGSSALLEIGAESARFALVEGPLRDFVPNPTVETLAEALPRLWRRYFTAPSQPEAELTDGGIEFRVRALPVWHAYFEYVVAGYVKELLEIHCANPVSTERVTHGHAGEYRYRFALDSAYPAASTPPPPSVSVRRRERERVLTDREFEVLRLVGLGKTNREIGFLLGISPKTVQHHVMHAYDKVGIYTRAGAALWLAERGLVA